MEFDPDLSHLTSKDYESIYEPSEDSFLLLTALHKDLIHINNEFKTNSISYPICIEIGSGSGICISYLSNLLNKQGIFYSVDVNPKACLATQKTFKQNKIPHYEVIRTDLLSCFKTNNNTGNTNDSNNNNNNNKAIPGMQFDIILFNPPYVPTVAEEMLGDDISMSWAGGKNGTETLYRFIDNHLNNCLSTAGLFYLVVLKQNLPEEINNHMSALGFESTQIIRKQMGIEDLQIVRFQRKEENNS